MPEPLGPNAKYWTEDLLGRRYALPEASAQEILERKRMEALGTIHCMFWAGLILGGSLLLGFWIAGLREGK